ncbi:MAG: hypothetical protein ACXVKA_01990 [Acidimicrobiia bacterium]
MVPFAEEAHVVRPGLGRAALDQVAGEDEAWPRLPHRRAVLLHPFHLARARRVAAHLHQDEQLAQPPPLGRIDDHVGRGLGAQRLERREIAIELEVPRGQCRDDGTLLGRRATVDVRGTDHCPQDRLDMLGVDHSRHRRFRSSKLAVAGVAPE